MTGIVLALVDFFKLKTFFMGLDTQGGYPAHAHSVLSIWRSLKPTAFER
jgi:hypothetical protein